jgi:hypothetical protein
MKPMPQAASKTALSARSRSGDGGPNSAEMSTVAMSCVMKLSFLAVARWSGER